MRILLTNDDGIYAAGIYALYSELKKIGTVIVVAPDSERSSVGHGITLAQPMWSKKVALNGRFFGTGVSGTPADCVKFAVGVLLKVKPDIVVSGINLGPNDGCSIFYSGTVAGAREGALIGIPSLAISLATFENPDFGFAARFAVKLTKHAVKKGMPKGTFLNVNIPNKKASQIKGVQMTHQGLTPIHGAFKRRVSPSRKVYYWMMGKDPAQKKDISVDTFALNNDYVTITPVRSDQTDYSFLDDLKDWQL